MALRPIDPVADDRLRRREEAARAMRPRAYHEPYARRHWSTLRMIKITVDPLCQRCGKAPAHEVHHRNGNAWDNRWANLESLCKPCHTRTTNRARLRRPGDRPRT
jgi:5-methylcytosine-specific restriction endonuclease McrA